MQGIIRTFVVYVLVAVLLCASAFAQSDRAILYSGQGAKLNGSVVPTSSAVLSGDNVETASGPAQLTAQGFQAQVEPATALKWGDVILLTCGGLSVSSDSNAIQASDTRITPVNGNSKFTVVNRGGKLNVNVQSGTVRVSGEEVTTLTAGQSIDRPSTDSCPAIASNDPAAAGHGAGKSTKWVILGAAGGGAAAAAILIPDRKNASNSKP